VWPKVARAWTRPRFWVLMGQGSTLTAACEAVGVNRRSGGGTGLLGPIEFAMTAPALSAGVDRIVKALPDSTQLEVHVPLPDVRAGRATRGHVNPERPCPKSITSQCPGSA